MGLEATDRKRSERGPLYDDVMMIYNSIVYSQHQSNSIIYFDELTKFFDQGKVMTRIRALEAILRILVAEYYEIENVVEITDTTQTPVNTILDWLRYYLPLEKEEKVFSTFFIFYKTYIKTFGDPNRFVSKSLSHLHNELLKNVKYGKHEAFERLHQRWFPKSYRDRMF